MFKSKSNGDIERLAKKFVNIKKTNSDRIKYLKLLIGMYSKKLVNWSLSPKQQALMQDK